jgi:hypothetical protein
LRYEDPSGEEIHNDDLTVDEQNGLIEDWKKKTGYQNIYFDKKTNNLVIDTSAGFKGGSAEARKQLGDAVGATNKIFDLVHSSEVIKRTGNLDDDSAVLRAVKLVQANQPAKVLTGEKDPGNLVLQNAFFVSPIDRKYTSARLLALNGAVDKALVEVYINRGPLAEEWYHVVIRKCARGWKFFSITQVAQS